MERNFPEALAHNLAFEGGWADNPNDPGGATMKGITLRTMSHYLQRDVSKAELRAVTDAEVSEVYHALYWTACACAQLPDGLDFAVFDAAVNTGPGEAVRLLQRLVGAPADGVIGAKTQSAVNDYVTAHGITALIDAYTQARQNFYRLLPTYVHFGEGWRKRAAAVAEIASGLAQQVAA